MKICLVNHYAVTPEQPGGTRHYFLARELVRRGHQVSIIASSFNHFSRSHLAPDTTRSVQRSTHDGVDFWFLQGRSYGANGLARVRGMLEFEKQVGAIALHPGFTRPDVVMGSSPHLFAARGAGRLAKALGARFVLEVRDLWPESLVEVAGARPWHPFIVYCRWVERRLYRRADAMVSLLPFAGEHIQLVAPGVKPPVWIPNGIELSIVPPVPPHPPGDRLRVVYAGSFGEANGLGMLVEALGLLPKEAPVEVCLYGGGAQTAELREASKRLPPGRLTVNEAVKKEDIYPIIQQHHVCFAYLRPLPLYRYGISLNKLYDYLASGRPILWAGQARNNPVAEAGAGITVGSVEPSEIASALLQFAATQTEARHRMGLAGRSFVESRHQFSLLAEKLECALASAA